MLTFRFYICQKPKDLFFEKVLYLDIGHLCDKSRDTFQTSLPRAKFLEPGKRTINRVRRIQWKWCSDAFRSKIIKKFYSFCLVNCNPRYSYPTVMTDKPATWTEATWAEMTRSALGYSTRPSPGSRHVHSVLATIWLYEVNCIKDPKWQPASQAH